MSEKPEEPGKNPEVEKEEEEYEEVRKRARRVRPGRLI